MTPSYEEISKAHWLLVERRQLLNRITEIEKILNMLSKKNNLIIDLTNDHVKAGE